MPHALGPGARHGYGVNPAPGKAGPLWFRHSGTPAPQRGYTLQQNSRLMERAVGTGSVWRFLPDVLAFGLGLSLAYFSRWNTGDLVWSLWLGSLVLGYLTLLSALAGGAWFGLFVITREDFEKKSRFPVLFGGVAFGLFMLGFFSLHFCGFHAGHSMFLAHFFPVEGMPEEGFLAAFMNPVRLWGYVFEILIQPYGLFLVPALLAERHHVFRPLVAAAATIRRAKAAGPTTATPADAKDSTDSSSRQAVDFMARPYLNVVRMHLLIFFFAGTHALGLDGFFVYAVVYAVYFFPWQSMRELRQRSGQAAEA